MKDMQLVINTAAAAGVVKAMQANSDDLAKLKSMLNATVSEWIEGLNDASPESGDLKTNRGRQAKSYAHLAPNGDDGYKLPKALD